MPSIKERLQVAQRRVEKELAKRLLGLEVFEYTMPPREPPPSEQPKEAVKPQKNKT